MRRFGARGARRVAGPDLMPLVFEAGQDAGLRHFLFGSTPDVLERLQARLLERYPRAHHRRHVLAAVPAAVRRGERRDRRSRSSTRARTSSGSASACPSRTSGSSAAPACSSRRSGLGVGAAFDFLAGTKPRAPQWMQDAGLEWLHRLLSEPRRLARRYAATNTEFVAPGRRRGRPVSTAAPPCAAPGSPAASPRPGGSGAVTADVRYRKSVIRGVPRPVLGAPWLMPLAVAVVAAAAAGALVVRAAPFAGVVVLAVVVFAYLAQMARRPLGEVLLVAMIGLAGIVDILQKIDAGAASGQAVETVAMVWLGFLVCLTGLAIPEGAAGRALGLLALFVAFTVVSYSWGTISTQSIQNVLVYIACLLFTAIAATVIRYRPRQLYEVISKAWWVAASVGLGLYAVSVAIAGPGTHKIISPRPLGLLGVLLVAWFVARRARRPQVGLLGGGGVAPADPALALALRARGPVRDGRAGPLRPAHVPELDGRDRGDRRHALGRDRDGVPVRAAAPPLLPRRHGERSAASRSTSPGATRCGPPTGTTS